MEIKIINNKDMYKQFMLIKIEAFAWNMHL
jgi:hypothetical protein